MHGRTRGIQGFLVVGGVLATLAAWPSAAAAALRIDSVTLNGAAYVQTAPGGVLQARLTVSGGDWQSTRIAGGGESKCANRDDNDDSDSTYTHRVTAPRNPGNYDISFVAYEDESCRGGASPEKVMPAGVRVTTPGPNPNLPARCGINVMLVLDESGSIQTSGATDAVKSATRAFLNALSGTGSRVSIIDFSSEAQRVVAYTTVTEESIDTIFEPYIDRGYDPNGWTNWEDAFTEVKTANTQGTIADLVVFMTDGDPTARNNPLTTGLTEGDVEAVTRASWQADAVKDPPLPDVPGSHVLALGVGEAVTDESSASRLTAVSGFDRYPSSGVEFSEADYTLVQNFDALAAGLREIAIELCEASISITKLVDEGDGVYRAESGWEFTASVSMSAGNYRWEQPAPPPSIGPRAATTGNDGVASFQWQPSNASAISRVSVAEAVNPGYEFVDATCGIVSRSGRGQVRVIRPVRSTIPRADVEVGPNQYARCTFRNRILTTPPTVGTIVIRKVATPKGSQAFGFTGSLGPFTLTDDGTAAATRQFGDLAPGTYTVSETVPTDWTLDGLACVPTGATQIVGPQATITLVAGQTVYCQFEDRRNDAPPEPPDPPIPPQPAPGPNPTPAPTPGPDPPPDPGTPPAPDPTTQLELVKRVQPVARVNRRLRFSVTVTNTGSVPATNVQVGDVPSAPLKVSGLQATVRPRIVRGNAIWTIGTLAPGESRTIRGSVMVDAGAPGIARNLALAAADNAQLVHAQADTRISALGILGRQQSSAPGVTG